MPPNTNTNPSLEETLLLEEMYGKTVDLVSKDPSLQPWFLSGKTKTRSAIEHLLGGEAAYNEVVGEKEKAVTPDVRQRIIARMVETNAGVNGVLQKSIEKPNEAMITVGGAKTKLSNYIRDPNSEDARILAWYFENVASKTDKERALQHLANTGEARDLISLMKVRKVYDELLADQANLDLDKKITKLNADIGTADTDMKALETKLSGMSVKAPGAGTLEKRIDRTEALILEKKNKIAEHEAKKRTVETKLLEIEDFSGVNAAALALLAADLNKAAFDTALSKNVPLAGGTHTIKEYVSDSSLRAWTDGLAETTTRSGIGKPSASDILKRVMSIEYKNEIADQAQRERFIERLKDVHRRADARAAAAMTAAAAAPAVLGAAPAPAVPTGGSAARNAPARSAAPAPRAAAATSDSPAAPAASTWKPGRLNPVTWAKSAWKHKGSLTAGAVIGGILIPVPGVGSVIGAAVAPWVARYLTGEKKTDSSSHS